MRMRMNVFGAFLFPAFLASILLASGVESAPPPSKIMKCRGGGDMIANYTSGSTGQSSLMINFRKATRGFKSQMPGPGECAWEHRAIHEKGANWLSWTFSSKEQRIDRLLFGSRKGNSGAHLPPNTGKLGGPTGRHLGVLSSIMEVEGRGLSGLIRAVHDGGEFVVRCHLEGQRYIVTSIVSITP